MSRPGIVAMMHFVRPNNPQFSGYIKYMNRSEAMRQAHYQEWNSVKYDGYNQYMENPEKSTGLFTAGKESLDRTDRQELKRQFELAQKNGSVMWQTVVSFDNTFLAEHGLYNQNNGQVDQKRLQQSIRQAMPQIFNNEGLANSALWTASIHLNTDNVHIHIATVEPEPTRPYKDFVDDYGHSHHEREGYFQRSTIGKFKSALANDLVNRNESLARLSDLLRNQLPKHDQKWGTYPDHELKDLYQRIYHELPEDKRKWRYNMNALNDVRPLLDAFSARYMKQYHGDELEEFDKTLYVETDFRRALYGDGQQGKERGRWKKYQDNKYDELFARMGNSILKEMREIDAKTHNNKRDASLKTWQKVQADRQNRGILSGLKSIKRALKGNVKQHFLAIREYEQSEREKESEHDRSQHLNNEMYR